MMADPAPIVPGLDRHRQRLLEYRWHVLDRHLAPLFGTEHPWHSILRYAERDHQRQRLLADLHCTVARMENWDAQSGGQRLDWVERILLPLARDLGLTGHAERGLISLALGNGCFDQPGARSHQCRRPGVDEVVRHVRAVLVEHDTAQQRAIALLERGICCDERKAHEVVKDLANAYVQRKAIGLLLNLLDAFSTYGEIGLLCLADDSAATALFFLEEQVEHIRVLTHEPQLVMGELRRDLLALHDGLKSVHHDLWQPHLLQEAPHAGSRKVYHKKIYPRLRARAVMAIGEYRDCDAATADRLFSRFEQEGLSGLVDWRCGLIAQTAQHAFELQRTLAAMAKVTVGIAPWAQCEIERLVRHLLTAIQVVGLALTPKTLIVDYPSSRRRQRWGRRLWFGVPAIMRRKQRHRKRHSIEHMPARRHQAQPQNRDIEPRADQLVAIFAERAQLDEQDARTRLRDFVTYGVLGLLPRGQWSQLLDERLMSWLRLMKLGRLDGTVAWSDVLHIAGIYCQELGISRPAAQVLRALFNSLPKPRYWHGVKGEPSMAYDNAPR